MSQEKVLKTLESVGLSESEAQIYVFLGKRGPQKAKDITKTLRIPKQNLYPDLKNLQGKGIVNATLERPARFSAVPFEKVLDLFVKVKMEEANQIRQGKAEILSDWRSISITESADYSPKFVVLEGRNFIYPRIKQMIEETKNQLSIILPVSSLLRADQAGLIDIALRRALKSETEIRFLTEVSKQNVQAVKILLARTEKAKDCFKGRTPALEPTPFTRMVIRDDEEAVFFITSTEPQNIEGKTDLCLWTNCKPLVQSFKTVFEELWLNSADIEEKIDEIETGKQTQRTCIISDGKTASKRYHDVLRGATKEIVMMTSPKDILTFSQNTPFWKDLNKQGVSIKIMAPIVNENLEAAKKLMEHFEVRHVPAVYIGATIVDGQHFFQFKNPLSDMENAKSIDCFENTFYTNDAEYVRKTEHMLKDIWNSAQVPSTIALKEIIQSPLPSSKAASGDIFEEYKKEIKKVVGFSYTMEPQQGTITEKEVLEKIANAVRIPAKDPKRDIVRIYGTQANAVIYPPKNLNLPNFIIIVFHNNRKSSFGVENSMQIYTQMKIAEHESYILAAFVTDNPRGYKFRKAMHKIRPTTEVAYLLRKEELNVQVHGEKLIAGWTVSIPLLPPKYILPPACIMFEGYGKTKTYSSEMIGPINPRLTYEYNMLDAFVTFMHPSSRYHGPGSDGILLRERILTSYPPNE